MAQISIHEVLERVKSLPELPEVLLRICQMLEDPNVTADALGKVIRNDASFTSQILRLCNSAAYGFNRQIISIKDAVAIMGVAPLRSMVYTIIAHRSLNTKLQGYGLGENDLWMNSLTCAFYAKHIAEKHRLCDPEHAFTAGILRDLGKLVLSEYVGPQYAELERYTLEHQINFVEAERDIMGIDHTMVGKKIAEHWKLPDKIGISIQYHHNPAAFGSKAVIAEQKDYAKILAAVHLADIFTSIAGVGTGRDGMMYGLDYDFLASHNIHITNDYAERLLSELLRVNTLIKQLVDSLKPVDAQDIPED